MAATAPLRIGEFARRVGVSPELLRAWERRYGLLQPIRSAGGFRLYTAADAARVERMRRALADGVSAAEAARLALTDLAAAPSDGLLEDAGARLLGAIRAYDETAVEALLDECFGSFGVEAVLRTVVLPTLTAVGDEWQRGELDVSQEHFGSNLIRGRLLSLSRLWGRGSGPTAVLGCATGELHDITLLAFGLVLRTRGWRVVFLGANTPVETLLRAAESQEPALVVLTSFDPRLLEAEADGIRSLARTAPLALGGPGATPELCERLGVRRLDGDLVAAAGELAVQRFANR